VMAPRPPLFLTGPMAALLGDSQGFSAKATLDYGTSTNRVELAGGKLLGLGAMLLFALESGEDLTRQAKEAGVSFIWNVTNNSGYFISEALQAYAPMSLSYHVTNISIKARSDAPERVESHRCERLELETRARDGSRASLIGWCAKDLNQLPLRILLQGSSR